ncbi:hypothetical protein Ciccas_010511 [Cichlidogyrus casuarinus]|uniref:Uncharacterized protein n=1 Tax=Cichlidogyrus casuarinus TaxID=1844966 RepID=A0ABD2PWV5_9PLAT
MIYNDAEKYASTGSVIPELHDLFMEQIGLCGEAGYTEMARSDWLSMILSWQDSSGCFKQMQSELMNQQNFDPKKYGNFRKRAETRIITRQGNHCLAHRTSVALSALSVYLRALVESSINPI